MESKNIVYERIILICKEYGIRNIAFLANELGYNSRDKLYRLKRNPNNRPSFQMLVDLAQVMKNLNIHWLVTGLGDMKIKEKQITSVIEKYNKAKSYDENNINEIIEYIIENENLLMRKSKFKLWLKNKVLENKIDELIKQKN